jgi:hypothetical protein
MIGLIAASRSAPGCRENRPNDAITRSAHLLLARATNSEVAMSKVALLAVSLALAATACSGTQAGVRPFPSGDAIALLDGPVHLGNDAAGGQAFTSGSAVGARVCSLVDMPEAADVHVQVVNVRMTETLSNLLTINGKGYPLPVTLERDWSNTTSVATSQSPIHTVHLEEGPSEICLVAGKMMIGGLDDFEVDNVLLYVSGIDVAKVRVRRGLILGNPPASHPPSTPWGKDQ